MLIRSTNVAFAYNGIGLGEGVALVVQNFKFRTNDNRKHKL